MLTQSAGVGGATNHIPNKDEGRPLTTRSPTQGNLRLEHISDQHPAGQEVIDEHRSPHRSPDLGGFCWRDYEVPEPVRATRICACVLLARVRAGTWLSRRQSQARIERRIRRAGALG